MRFAFVTCVQIGLSCIEKIYESGHKLELVITLNDNNSTKKSGRVFLDNFCKNNNIQLLKVDNINEDICKKKITSLKIDWLFIIGWSQIAKLKILNSPKHGVIGAHPTLLPQGRGRASIPWAILKSLNYTGVSFFKLDENVDTGKIIYQKKIKIDKNENATSLYEKVVLTHMDIISEVIKNILKSKISYIEQIESKSSYWPGRSPKDGKINLKGSIMNAEKLIRATTRPYPGAYYIKNGNKIIIWSAKILNDDEKLISNNSKILKFKDGLLLIKDYTKIKNVSD